MTDRLASGRGQRPTASARTRRQQARTAQADAATSSDSDGHEAPVLTDSDAEEEPLIDLSEEESPRVRAPRSNRLSEVDVSGLSESQAKKKRSDFKKQRAREARKRHNERKKAYVEDAALAEPKHYALKTLEEVQAQREGGIFGFIRQGDAYATKVGVDHEIRELAESLCLTVRYQRNTKSELLAMSEDFHGTQPRPLVIHASFCMSTRHWKVTKVALSGAMGLGPQVLDGKLDPNWRKYHARTAFTEEQLAWHAKNAISAQPSFPRASFVALFTNTMRFPELISGDVWSRVRRKAYYFSLGVPDDNVALLPCLQDEMKKYGHDLEYDSIDGSKMLTCILSVRKAECDRRRKAAGKVSAAARTRDQIDDLVPWPEQRRKFEETHAEFLKGIAAPGARYINYLAIAFSFVKQQFVSLLKFVSADACFGRFHLDAFQVFSVCGVTSNGNIVPLGYVLISGNESEETWTRAWTFFQSKFPSLNGSFTLVTDGDKGIPAAVDTVFGSDKPFELRCSKHRSENLRLRHGKAAQSEFWRCARAKTVTEIARIRNTPTYRALVPTSREALSSVADCQQFPAAAAARGANLYGRDSNQLSEVDNNAITPARSLDPTLFVLWHCRRASQLYTKFHHESRACESFLTPHATKRLKDVVKTGAVHPIPAEYTASHQAFNVLVGDKVYKVHLRVPTTGDENQSWFPVDKLPCSCGVPAIEHMPCGHMLAVAEQVSLNPTLVVPYVYTTAAWVLQYPDIDVYVPTVADLRASRVEGDDCLRNPVAAPPKRGRPAKRRIRGVMERIVKRARLNAGR